MTAEISGRLIFDGGQPHIKVRPPGAERQHNVSTPGQFLEQKTLGPLAHAPVF